MDPTLGIDFGTTNSSVGVWRRNHVHIIPDAYGNLSTSSCVSFFGPDRIIGGPTNLWTSLFPEDSIYDVKRIMGRKFEDPNIQKNLKHWAFKIIDDCNKPKIQAAYKGEIRNYHPVGIASLILAKLKQNAEDYLKVTIRNAIVAVPAYFNDYQRQAIKDAVLISGLNVLKFINEPTAAALAYGLGKGIEERNILIFDLGGGKLDVSIINISGGDKYTVRSNAGDTSLGGEDFTNRLLDYLVDDFMHKYNEDIRQDLLALRRLRNAAEVAKYTLSSSIKAKIKLNSLYKDISYHTTVTREKFEELNADLFLDALRAVEKALYYAKLDKNSIQDVILIGLSTCIPKIQNMLQDFFNGMKLNMSLKQTEAVVTGAAILGGYFKNEKNSPLQGIRVQEVASLPITIETGAGVMRLFDRTVKLTITHRQTFTTSSNNQTTMTIRAYEAERGFLGNKNLLDTFEIIGIPPAPRGEQKIHVNMSLDLFGIFIVFVSDFRKKKIMIKRDKGRVSRDEFNTMVNDITLYKMEHAQWNEIMAAQCYLGSYVTKIKQMVEDCDDILSMHEELIALNVCDEIEQWLKINFGATIEDYKQKLSKVDTTCTAIIKKVKNEMIKNLPQQQQTDEKSNRDDVSDYNVDLKEVTTRTNLEDLDWILRTRLEAIAADYRQVEKENGASGGSVPNIRAGTGPLTEENGENARAAMREE